MSHFPSFPTFHCKTPVEDAPLKNLPAVEEALINHLDRRLHPLFHPTKSALHAEDPWRTLTNAERKYLYLRFGRYHVLNKEHSEAHIREVAAWRADQKPWQSDFSICCGVKAGLPVQLLPAVRGADGEMLMYLPARLYTRASVDHGLQQTAVRTLFEFCMYASGGCRAASGVYVVDFAELCMKNVDLIAMKNAIRIFQASYPEAFKRLLFINYPKWIYGSKCCCFVSPSSPLAPRVFFFFSLGRLLSDVAVLVYVL